MIRFDNFDRDGSHLLIKKKTYIFAFQEKNAANEQIKEKEQIRFLARKKPEIKKHDKFLTTQRQYTQRYNNSLTR